MIAAARDFGVTSKGMFSIWAKRRRGSSVRHVIAGNRRDSTRSRSSFAFAAFTFGVGFSMSS